MRAIHALRGSVRAVGMVAAVALFAASQTVAADTYRPFVLAYTESGTDVSGEAASVRERLEGADFRFLGEYPVSNDRHVVVVTHDDLLSVAGSEERGGYIAPIRVAVTAVDGELQVSYNNLEYFRHAYRLDRPVTGVATRLSSTLGAEREYGSEDGLSERDLSRYRYTFGMERFDAPYELASHGSRRAALSELDGNLASRVAGVSEVYRVDIPGQDVTVIGVAVREADGADQDSADLHQLGIVDVGEFRHTATVPLEIMVRGGEVEALHMRFRKALHFPDLRMLGDNSFMRLRSSPGALEETLKAVAGHQEREDSGFEW
ncbi:hypothetical protein [Thioalkalivibrio versutus]|uniref:hypothetical protein n=1 Tax=Thioalkalivibrio versutus TaxID=106634 RepID=UPI00037A29C3|nr:hypothetical protein [Thioalkalivibrio versutus]OOC48956.1 hypothetical protein B0684_06775 [Thioalkalivibrio versutus]